MSHRAHLASFKIASAVRETLISQGYSLPIFVKDLIAGLTVGIVSTPVSLALAIACGVPPQHGLYTAIIAGFIIALLGGSRYSISGPTAAFVVILYPITQKFGLEGLLMATFLAGLILIGMSVARLGRLIEYIPETVTLGFTLGIAIVLATLQIKDFLGLSIEQLPSDFYQKASVLITHLPTTHWPDAWVGISTLGVLIVWPYFKTKMPSQLPALLLGVLLSIFLTQKGYFIETIDSRFSGIPSNFPAFNLPWQAMNFDTLQAILPAAFSIALLGAIESLLCAVILDRLSGTRHHSNSELFAQGVANILTPFFGGITATAAVARSVTNLKAGAMTPVAGMLQALFVLLAIVLLSQALGHLPMSSMSAILMMTAWNMSEPHKVYQVVKKSPSGDIMVFTTCLLLTVFFDMVMAITAGVILSSLLFMKNISRMTKIREITHDKKHVLTPLSKDWGVYQIQGPLFFAAADAIFSELAQLTQEKQGIIVQLEGAALLDAGGISAMTQFFDTVLLRQQRLIVCDIPFQPLKTMAKAGIQPVGTKIQFCSTLSEALQAANNRP